MHPEVARGSASIRAGSCAPANASASTSSRTARRNAAVGRDLRPRPQRDFRDQPCRPEMGRHPQGCRLVPLHRHHARTLRRGRASHARRRARGEEPRTDRQLRPQLPQETLVGRKGGKGHERPDGARRHLHRERGGRGKSFWHQGRRDRSHAREDRPQPLRRRSRANSPRDSSSRVSRSRCRESFSASHNGWSGLYYTDGREYFSRRYDIQIVDRVGGGDSFGGRG